jgi:hypothetical protein
MYCATSRTRWCAWRRSCRACTSCFFAVLLVNGAATKSFGKLALDAATALTNLQLRVSAHDANIVRRLQLPPQLQVLP